VAVLIDFLLVVFIWVDLRGLPVTVDDTLARLERADPKEVALRAAFFWLSLALVCAWSFYFAREWPVVPFLLLAVFVYETWACVRLVFFRDRHLAYLQRIRHAPLLLLKVPAYIRLGLCGFLLYKHLFG
jgi:hypothetical protein